MNMQIIFKLKECSVQHKLTRSTASMLSITAKKIFHLMLWFVKQAQIVFKALDLQWKSMLGKAMHWITLEMHWKLFLVSPKLEIC